MAHLLDNRHLQLADFCVNLRGFSLQKLLSVQNMKPECLHMLFTGLKLHLIVLAQSSLTRGLGF